MRVGVGDGVGGTVGVTEGVGEEVGVTMAIASEEGMTSMESTKTRPCQVLKNVPKGWEDQVR
ncbi:MAG: hypothetical protein QXQ02_00710 [Halobacteria archaeon]